MATKTQSERNAEKIRLAQEARNDRYARFYAVLGMVVFLSGSLAANVATAWNGDLIAKIVAGAPPVSLFITSMMFERMRSNVPTKVGMALSVVVSLAFSWYHITLLVLSHGQPFAIALVFPVIVDIPMLFAGWILLNQAKPVIPDTAPKASHSTRTVTVPRTATKKHTTPTLSPILST